MKKLKIGLFALSFSFLVPAPLLAANGGSECGVPELSSCPVPIDRNPPPVKDMLNWGQAQRLVGFRNDFRSYTGDVFKHGTPLALPKALVNLDDVSYRLDGATYKLADYFRRNDVKGFLVLKNNRIAYEYYADGNNNTTLWTSRSVGKSIVSTLTGVALKEGKIKSLDDRLTVYNPDLAKTDWADVTVRQLLQHTSGIQWNEDYTDPASDFSKLTQCEAGMDTYACVQKLVYQLKAKPGVKPGQEWSYSSGGAWMLGDILERATGRPIAKYLEEKIWQPFGMADDGVWHSYEKGKHDVGAHGFNATLEDWGRLGLFVADNGRVRNGTTILPERWVRDARTWTRAENSVSADHPEGTYGYEWWNNAVPEIRAGVSPKTGLEEEDTIWALGIYGQMIVINQKENLVIVQWATWPVAEPSFDKQPLEAALMFNAIANTLKQ